MAVKTFGDGSQLSQAEKQTLRDSLKCEVVYQDEIAAERYNELIHRWNEAYQERATIIVLAESETDVASAIRFATKHKIDMAVCCGGHSYFGASSTTGMVIDLRKMNQVSVDKANKTVTSGGGCLARDLEGPAAEEGLAVVFGAVNETGIGGLTLGGGIGWLSGQYGLALDNLLSARVALANGEVVTASDTENTDLFWAIRGAGGNFGIVTEFVFRAHDQPGLAFFEMVSFAPEKLGACLALLEPLRHSAVEPSGGKFAPNFCLMTPPGAPTHCPTFLIFYDGPESEARAYAQPIYDLGSMGTMGGPMPYPEVTGIVSKLEPPGANRWASSSAHMNHPVNVPTVKAACEEFMAVLRAYAPKLDRSMFILDIRDYRKVASVPVSATAYSSRRNTAILVGDLRCDEPEMDAVAREETRKIARRVKEAVAKERVSEAKVRANDEEEVGVFYGNISAGNEKIESLFGTNLPRLRELKKKYDPEGVWNKWFPITVD